jgi:hypothetical protein
MQRMTSWARPRGMISHDRIRGVAAAGLLCAALAGCGAAAAATSPPAAGAGGVARSAAAAVGCASVNEATSVTVTRYLVVKEPVIGGTRTYNQRNATKVRALFRDFCAVIAHAGRPLPELTCAFKFGNSFKGTFYDGRRILATFGYSLEACPRLSFTAAGKTRVAIVIGKVAAAAPHLTADLAAVLGVPVWQV